VPQVIAFEPAVWPILAAGRVQNAVDLVLAEQGCCSVMLTGGRSAERLYLAWCELPAFQLLAGVRFYFGDERCVAADHVESNYGMAMRTLFHRGVPAGCKVFRMEADDPDQELAARNYEQLLPEQVDVMLLGVGEDGHVASLFPGSPTLDESIRLVVPTTSPKPPAQRLTVTRQVIEIAKSVFVLAPGALKARLLNDVLRAPAEAALLPVSWAIVRPGSWIFH
jgi:6-phosphogluconolactonase